MDNDVVERVGRIMLYSLTVSVVIVLLSGIIIGRM